MVSKKYINIDIKEFIRTTLHEMKGHMGVFINAHTDFSDPVRCSRWIRRG